MVTKAIIKSLPFDSNNKFGVEIPIFASAGMDKRNNLSSVLMEATLCYQPGINNSFNIGDVVFVSFEDNQLSRPIIIGKLYVESDKNVGYASLDTLDVGSEVELPNNTFINKSKVAIIDDIPLFLTSLDGYNASKTQILKNINGTFTWVDE